MINSVKNIYCISGLGADERAFERLKVEGCKFYYLNTITPLPGEPFSSYAKRMSAFVNESNPVILGLSFGGMIAVEMAKHIEIEKLILISSVKTYNEVPRWMRIAGRLNLNKVIPIRKTRLTEKADDRRMGIETEEEKKFVDHYRRNVDYKYVHWAVDQVLNWKNNWFPSNTFHIHGEHDRMFPLKNIKATHVIRNGTHIMILNRADEISSCIEQIIFHTETGTKK